MSAKRHSLFAGMFSLGLGACLLFWLIPAWVEPDADLRLPVSLVPQVVAVGFVLCGAAMLVRALIAQPRQSDAPGRGFDDGEFRGLLLMLAILLGATVGFQFLHFLIVAPLVVAVSMWIFAPIRPVSLILTSAIGPLLIWLLATQVLGRVLP